MNSQGQSKTSRELQELDRVGRDLNRMIEEGRSFSGRERNSCFLNDRSGGFSNISAVSGLDFLDDGRAVALVDWDHDGDLDLWTSNRNAPRLRLMRNEMQNENHFVALRLQGNGTTTNRDAIGARVEVVARGLGQQKLIKTLRAGEGFLAQSSKWIHFGLGDATPIDHVSIRWPGGDVEQFAGLEVDRRYHLVQGSGESRLATDARRDLALSPSTPELPPQSGAARVRLTTLLPMPRQVNFKDFDGSHHQLRLGAGKPVLISLWASWCAPCVAELNELTSRSAEIRAVGIDVVALSVDGLGNEDVDSSAAPNLLAEMKFPFPAGSADGGFVKLLQGFHNNAVVLQRAMPIPTSVLVDEEGRLAVIYKGRIVVDELLQDVEHSRGTGVERWVGSASFAGRAIMDDRFEQARKLEESRLRWQLAEALNDAGRLELAAAHYRELLNIEPEFGKACRKLALVYERLHEPRMAIQQYQRAIELEPDLPGLHYNLSNLLNRAGRYDEAIVGYRRAIELKKDFAEAHVNLGSVLTKMERYEEAMAEFERAVEINPDSAQAAENLRRIREFLQAPQ
jgi:thiol-disulfide isomerase/thioredoxin